MDKKGLVGLALILGTVFLLGGCADPSQGEDRSCERVQVRGKLLVAIDPTYPPMEFEGKDGQPAGFDIDFAKELAKRIGVQAEFVVMDWSGIVAGLQSQRYDVIICSMNITEERRRQVEFVEYLRMSQVFVCQQGTRVETELDLAGKVVSIQTNTTSHTWVENVQNKGIAIKEIKAFPAATDPFNAVKVGQAEVIVTDEPVGKYYARRDPTFVVTGQAIEAQAVGIALRKADLKLQLAVCQAVADMKREGAFRSPNAGAGWEHMQNGLPDKNISSISYDEDGKRLLATSTETGVVFESVDAGHTWTRGPDTGYPLRNISVVHGRFVAATPFDGVVMQPESNDHSASSGAASRRTN